MATWSLALEEKIQHKESFKPLKWGVPACQNSYCTRLSSLPYQKTKAAFDD